MVKKIPVTSKAAAKVFGMSNILVWIYIKIDCNEHELRIVIKLGIY